MESGRFGEQAIKAVNALIKHEKLASSEKTVAGKQSLLGEEKNDSVFLIIGFTKMSEKTSLKPVRINVPHPFRKATDEDLSVCLLTKDPQRLYKDLVAKTGLLCVTKVQGISKLKAKFKPYEAKRQLCGSFDLFLADARIIPMLPKVIGKTFFAKKKQPVAVNLESSQPEHIKKELMDAIESTFFFQTGGSSVSIRIGKIDQSALDMSENIKAAVKSVAAKLEGGLGCIRSVHVKTSTSVSLPIFIKQTKSA